MSQCPRGEEKKARRTQHEGLEDKHPPPDPVESERPSLSAALVWSICGDVFSVGTSARRKVQRRTVDKQELVLVH